MNRMTRHLAHLALGLLVALAAARADAISISMDPAASVIAVGDSVAIALNVSGLVDNAAPSLAVYDIDVTWDPGLLQLGIVSVGDPLLGNQLDLVGLGTVSTISFGTGTVGLSEQSLDSIADLTNLQAGSFTLATLTFQLLDVGPATITPSIIQAAEVSGLPLPIDSITGAEVSAIPEPSAALLALVGVLVVQAARSPRNLGERPR
jgi:hypothetical protein